MEDHTLQILALSSSSSIRTIERGVGEAAKVYYYCHIITISYYCYYFVITID